MAKNDDQWCITQAEIATVSYTWTIKNFSFFKNSEVVRSSTFSSSNAKDIKWYINLYPNGYNENSRGYVSIYVFTSSEAINGVIAELTVSILTTNKENNIVLKLSDLRTFGIKLGGWGWLNSVKCENLKNMAEVFLPNDTLTILCEIKYMVESTTVSGDNSFLEIPECRLTSDFSDLLKNETLSDVILLVDGTKFNAHRNILAARSSVFNAMFAIEMKEKNENVVEIPGINPNAFYKMLYFIYTGLTPDLTPIKQTCELLEIADKYDLQRLKLICEDFLCSQITVENVSEMLALSDLHGCDQLKANSSRYMQNNFAHVQKTKSWNSLFRRPPPCELLNEEEKEFLGMDDVGRDCKYLKYLRFVLCFLTRKKNI